MKKFLGSLVAALAVLGIFSLPLHVNAQENETRESITLSPAVLQPEFNGGQRGVGKLTVLNDGDAEYTFLVYARPFSVQGEEYSPNYVEINERTQAYQWVQFKQNSYTLKPGQQVEVDYTVNVPKSAAGGGHYAVIFAETQPPTDVNFTGVVRKKRVGSLLYMTVSGETRREGSVASWEAGLWQRSSPIKSSLRLQNTGNVHFQADLKATYKNLLGKTKFELNQQILVIPGTTRRVPVEWKEAPTIGLFTSGGTLSYLGKTESLPKKYVIVAPIYVPIIVLLAVAAVVARVLLKRKKSPKKASRFSGRR